MLYSDGDEELLNLKKENWKLIGNNDFPEGVGFSSMVYFLFCCAILHFRKLTDQAIMLIILIGE